MAKPARDAKHVHLVGVVGELHDVIGQLKRRLRDEANLGDLTWSQKSVIRRLDREGPATVTNLARAEGMRPQSMGETLAVLRKAGLVCGAPDPSDGRRTVLSLTSDCRKKIRLGRAAREDCLFRAIQSKLSPGEQKQLAIGVELLKRIVEG